MMELWAALVVFMVVSGVCWMIVLGVKRNIRRSEEREAERQRRLATRPLPARRFQPSPPRRSPQGSDFGFFPLSTPDMTPLSVAEAPQSWPGGGGGFSGGGASGSWDGGTGASEGFDSGGSDSGGSGCDP